MRSIPCQRGVHGTYGCTFKPIQVSRAWVWASSLFGAMLLWASTKWFESKKHKRKVLSLPLHRIVKDYFYGDSADDLIESMKFWVSRQPQFESVWTWYVFWNTADCCVSSFHFLASKSWDRSPPYSHDSLNRIGVEEMESPRYGLEVSLNRGIIKQLPYYNCVTQKWRKFNFYIYPHECFLWVYFISYFLTQNQPNHNVLHQPTLSFAIKPFHKP